MANAIDGVKSYMQMTASIYDKMWEMWMMGANALIQSQEQVSDYYHKYLDQIQQFGSENARVSEEILKQAKENQIQVQNMLKDSISSVADTSKMPGLDYFNELNQKINQLSTQAMNSFSDLPAFNFMSYRSTSTKAD